MKKNKRIEKDMNGDLVELSLGNSTQPEWEEVVDDELILEGDKNRFFVRTSNKDIDEFIIKTFNVKFIQYKLPVRIKCRKGAILIERLRGVGK